MCLIHTVAKKLCVVFYICILSCYHARVIELGYICNGTGGLCADVFDSCCRQHSSYKHVV